MIGSRNARFLVIKRGFNDSDLPADSITIEGNWDSFVKQGYINALQSQIQKQFHLNHTLNKTYKELNFEIESSLDITHNSKDSNDLTKLDSRHENIESKSQDSMKKENDILEASDHENLDSIESNLQNIKEDSKNSQNIESKNHNSTNLAKLDSKENTESKSQNLNSKHENIESKSVDSKKLQNLDSIKTASLDSKENTESTSQDSKNSQNIESNLQDFKTTQNIESKNHNSTNLANLNSKENAESKSVDSKKLQNLDSIKTASLDSKENTDSTSQDSKDLQDFKTTQNIESKSQNLDSKHENIESKPQDFKVDSKAESNPAHPLQLSFENALCHNAHIPYKTHNITQESYINIIFKNAKVGINFMFLLKQILESSGFKNINIYTDSLSIITLLPYLESQNYALFCNDFAIINKNIESKIPPKITLKKPKITTLFLEFIGKWAYNFYQNSIAFFNFLGMFLYFFAHSIFKPSNFRLKSLFFHLYEQGFKALPVGLGVAFIVGYAITLQGAYQLDSMGVPIMSVDTTAKLALREMGPFILALVIAGRSASSFTAELGSMRLTEELSAMQAMNLNIFYFLIIPRILALIIVMPLMVFAADAVSLFGGMIAIKYSINIGFEAYLERFYETVSLTHFWIGVVKAPVFGAIIGIVGCFRGLECKGDTQSIGRMTTTSVVNAIFWIIMANAIFSFIFTRYNL